MKRLPIGIQTFRKLIDGNYLYVDKTEHIKDKKYFEKYQGVGKEIYLFGVAFTDRNIGDWVIEKL